jgi:CubicO group peptidase (beta-lactamase class C family)
MALAAVPPLRALFNAFALAAGIAAYAALATPAQARELPAWSALGDVFVDVNVDLSLAGSALWIEHAGRPVLYRPVGNVAVDTRMPIASGTKWLSAILLARLVERGALRWDSTVGEFFPDAPLAKRRIRLEQLFSHTSGMASGEPACVADPFASLDACAREILAAPLAYAPGTGFAYGGSSMQVAGRMAELATGETWTVLFEREVVQPLGLRDTDYGLGTDLPGNVHVSNPRIGGGVRSTADDYLVVLRMWANDGLHGRQRFLRAETLREMERDRAAGLPVISTPYEPSQGYGIGFWRITTTTEGAALRIASPGAFGFHPWVDRQAGVVGVVAVLDIGARLIDGFIAIGDQANAIARESQAFAAPLPTPRGARLGLPRDPPGWRATPDGATAPSPRRGLRAPPAAGVAER